MLQLNMLSALLGDLCLQLLNLELDGVELNEELGVLLGSLLYVVLGTCLILNGVDFESGN